MKKYWVFFLILLSSSGSYSGGSYSGPTEVRPGSKKCPCGEEKFTSDPFKSAEVKACEAQLEAQGCTALAEKMKDPTLKVRSCDPEIKKLQESWTDAGITCVANSIKLPFQGLWDTGKMAWDIGKMAIDGFSQAKACYYDVEGKKGTIALFNLSVSDPNFHIKDSEASDEFLKDVTCERLNAFITLRGKAYKASSSYKELIAAGPNPCERPNSPDRPKICFLEELKKELGVRYECYSRQAKAEIACHALIAVAVPTLGRAAVAKLAESIGDTYHIHRALAAFQQGNKVKGLTHAGQLSNSGRIQMTEEALGRSLTKNEKDALIRAHNIAPDKGYFEYTPEELKEKTRILRETRKKTGPTGEEGFSNEEVSRILRIGAAGNSPADLRAAATQAFRGKIEAQAKGNIGEYRVAAEGNARAMMNLPQLSTDQQATIIQDLLAAGKKDLAIERLKKSPDRGMVWLTLVRNLGDRQKAYRAASPAAQPVVDHSYRSLADLIKNPP